MTQNHPAVFFNRLNHLRWLILPRPVDTFCFHVWGKKNKQKKNSQQLTVAGSTPVSAGHQWSHKRTLKSSYGGQWSLLRAEPRGSVVIVHAEKRASTWAAGAKTHNINAFVHPGGWEGSRLWCLSSRRGGRSRERREKGWGMVEERSSHLHKRPQDVEEEEKEGGMSSPGDLSALGGALRSEKKRPCVWAEPGD